MAYSPVTGLKLKRTPRQTSLGQQTASSLPDGFDPVTGTYDPALPGSLVGQLTAGPGAAPAGSVTIPGFTPDYGQLIANDPLLGQLRSDLGAQGIADLGARNAAIQRALVQFGEVPDLQDAARQLGFDLSGIDVETTRQLAGANQQSVTARAKRQHEKNVQALQDFLAARGALRSGALGVGLQEEQDAYEGGLYDSRLQLLDYFSGVQQAYLDSERGRQAQLAQGRESAAGRAVEQHQPTGEQTLQLNPATGLYGPDRDGNWYTADGRKANPPAPSPPGPAQPPPPPSPAPPPPGGRFNLPL